MRFFAAVVIVMFALTAGCGKGNKPFTLQGTVENLMGPPATQQVSKAFDVDDPDRRREGIVALSSNKWGLVEPHLKGYAAILRTDDHPVVRAAAVRALGKAGDEKYLDDIIRTMSDPSDAVRVDTVIALENFHTKAVESVLQKHAADDASPQVRSACAKVLKKYRTKSTFAVLVGCLNDKNMVVRYNAHQSLVDLAGLDMGMGSDAWKIQMEQPVAASRPAKGNKKWRKFLRAIKGLKGKPKATPKPTTKPSKS